VHTSSDRIEEADEGTRTEMIGDAVDKSDRPVLHILDGSNVKDDTESLIGGGDLRLTG
jgi:hypothetical protein